MLLDSTLKRHDNLMPQQPGGMRKGTALALLVHVGLIIALAFGVAWRSQTPAGVSAELWAAVPQVAAPPAPPAPEPPKPAPTPAPPPPAVKAAEPPPKPAQVDPQIAIEKEKAERKQREEREQQERDRKERERLEQEKAEKLAAEKVAAEKLAAEKAAAEKLAAQKQRELDAKRQKEEEARQAKQREENLKRMLASTGTAPAGTAARDAGPSASYAGRIIARVKPNIVLTDEVPGNPSAEVEVRCAPDGVIVGRRLVKSSGNKEWDNAVLRAIDRTEILPKDTDGRVPSSMVIEFRPRD